MLTGAKPLKFASFPAATTTAMIQSELLGVIIIGGDNAARRRVQVFKMSKS
jgi:hypothetical protein